MTYAITETLATDLRQALADAGRDDVEILVNPDGGEDLGATDDEICFRTQGAESASLYHVQSGPYGVGLNKDFYEDGAYAGIEHVCFFGKREHGKLVKKVVTMIDEIVPRATAPAP